MKNPDTTPNDAAIAYTIQSRTEPLSTAAASAPTSSEAQHVRHEHDQARRMAVGEGPAEQHHGGPGDPCQRQDETELERVVGDAEHQPGQGDQVELVSQM